MNKIKYILVDVDDTLLDFYKCCYTALENLFAERGYPFSEELVKDYTEWGNELWKIHERGEATWREVCEKRWMRLSEKYSFFIPNILELDDRFRFYLGEAHHKIEGADEVLSYLHQKGYKLYVASNSTEIYQKKRLKDSNLISYFDGFFLSQTIGASKPKKEFFDYCFSALGNPDKKAVMMLGDRITSDMVGGKEYGIITCWFDRRREENFPSDYKIHSLKELKEIL